jgi:hypothetical protein
MSKKTPLEKATTMLVVWMARAFFVGLFSGLFYLPLMIGYLIIRKLIVFLGILSEKIIIFEYWMMILVGILTYGIIFYWLIIKKDETQQL